MNLVEQAFQLLLHVKKQGVGLLTTVSDLCRGKDSALDVFCKERAQIRRGKGRHFLRAAVDVELFGIFALG